MALSIFYKLPDLDTFLKELFPDSLPSGRLYCPSLFAAHPYAVPPSSPI